MSKPLLALPLVTSNPEFKSDVLIVAPEDIKAVNVVWDKEDESFELYVHVGANRTAHEVLSGLTDLLINLGWDSVEDPYGVLNGIVEAEHS